MSCVSSLVSSLEMWCFISITDCPEGIELDEDVENPSEILHTTLNYFADINNRAANCQWQTRAAATQD